MMSIQRIARTAVSLALNLTLAGVVLGPATLAAPFALAQTRGPVQRTIHGKVENKNGQGIKGAVVYVKDGRTSSVRSAISDDDGSFRFVQLSQNTDYEVWAQSEGKKSNTRSISSFDSKNDFDMTLRISQ
jgi:hypothetical protein